VQEYTAVASPQRSSNYVSGRAQARQEQQEVGIERMNTNELVPDISVTRVIKWAIVLLIAMALGRKVWNQFGEKITNGMNKALDGVIGEEKKAAP
jgi:hypothetical protein